jgi:hypothetical protein
MSGCSIITICKNAHHVKNHEICKHRRWNYKHYTGIEGQKYMMIKISKEMILASIISVPLTQCPVRTSYRSQGGQLWWVQNLILWKSTEECRKN